MRKLWVLIFVFLLVGCSVLPETPVEPIEVEEPVEFVFEEPAEHVLPIADTPEEETTPWKLRKKYRNLQVLLKAQKPLNKGSYCHRLPERKLHFRVHRYLQVCSAHKIN